MAGISFTKIPKPSRRINPPLGPDDGRSRPGFIILDPCSCPPYSAASCLHRLTRCPNYFGEILVWTGQLLAGAALLGTWLSWILAAIGYAGIVLVMIGSARRLELKQEARYGADPAFQAYVKRVPVLLPFLRVYTLKDAKLYLG